MNEQDSLKDKIRSWLETQGYTTEMKVAMTLHNAGFGVLKSHYYDDPETKISREIDVVSMIHDQLGLLEVYSVIECKKSQKPWILFTSEFGELNRFTSFAIMREATWDSTRNKIEDMVTIDWFRKDGRIAYGVTEAFSSKEDATFKAGVSATKAAISLCQSDFFGGAGLNFFFPTVVVDGELFECYLDSKGTPVIEEIDFSFLNFQIRFGDQQGASIHVVRLGAFEKYCEKLKETFAQLKITLKSERVKQAIKYDMRSDLIED